MSATDGGAGTVAPEATTHEAAEADPAPRSPGFGEALRFWLKLGLLSFGGPAGQIALMHEELVERKRWISERRYLHALNYCMVLPGPEAQQLATYIGWLLHGVRGGIVAGALFVLPSLVLLIALSWLYMAHGQTPAVAAVLWGIKPAVTALVLAAAWRIGKRSLKHPLLWAIAVAAFFALQVLQLPFPAVVLGAGLIGVVAHRFVPQAFQGGGGHGSAKLLPRPAVIDDHTPTPAHARFTRARLVRTLIVGLGLWAVAMATLVALSGWQATLSQMGWFFTKAALLTFGGAYAVLPYVAQSAVEHYGWLTAPQMIDGLALGETTPGPLIMVVAFVAFVGGWTQQVLGPDHLMAGAALAACVVTFFTFLPSFVFILAGGPLVEATHGHMKLQAPLTAITAAVVGVIVTLAIFFAEHVLWPQGFAGPFDWPSAALGVAAAVALMRFNANVMLVIAACAGVGLLRGLLF